MAPPKIKLGLWRNGKLFQKPLGKLRGTLSIIYRCFWLSRRVNGVIVGLKALFLEPRNKVIIILRGTIVNRTHGKHKNLHTRVFNYFY